MVRKSGLSASLRLQFLQASCVQVPKVQETCGLLTVVTWNFSLSLWPWSETQGLLLGHEFGLSQETDWL